MKKTVKKFGALLLAAVMVLVLLAGCQKPEPAPSSEVPGPSGQETQPTEPQTPAESPTHPAVYEDCETAWEAANNIRVGWNLGLSLSPYLSTKVESFVALIYFHDTAEP